MACDEQIQTQISSKDFASQPPGVHLANSLNHQLLQARPELQRDVPLKVSASRSCPSSDWAGWVWGPGHLRLKTHNSDGRSLLQNSPRVGWGFIGSTLWFRFSLCPILLLPTFPQVSSPINILHTKLRVIVGSQVTGHGLPLLTEEFYRIKDNFPLSLARIPNWCLNIETYLLNAFSVII